MQMRMRESRCTLPQLLERIKGAVRRRSKHLKYVRFPFFGLILAYLTYNLLQRFPYYPKEWVWAFTLICFLVALKYDTGAIYLSTFLVSFASLYQCPELGLLMFAFYFIGLSLSCGRYPDSALMIMAMFAFPNPFLQAILLPLLGLAFSRTVAVKSTALYTLVLFTYTTLAGISSYGFFYTGVTIPYFQLKTGLSDFSIQPIIEELRKSRYTGFNVLANQLMDSPAGIIQMVLWTIASSIPGFVVRRRRLNLKNWAYLLPFCLGANVILFLAHVYALNSTNPDPTQIINFGLLSSPMLYYALLGGALALLVYPGTSFYYRLIAPPRPAYEPRREPEVEKPAVKPAPSLKWEDIGGLSSVKQELREAVELCVKEPKLFSLYKIRPTKGLLLFGPPGCGKTLLARVTASQINATFREVKGSDIFTRWFGESEQRISELFEELKKQTPAILCLDEVEALMPKREEATTSEAMRRMVSTFLQEMDGLEPLQGIFIFAITNQPDLIDEALLRPGRFDKIIYVPPPDREARKRIFQIHLSGRPLSPDVDFDKLAEITERWSGADIELACNETAAGVAREAQKIGEAKAIAMQDLEAIIKSRGPSVSLQMIRKYEQFKAKYERRGLESESVATLMGPKLSWEDIGGYEAVKQLLRESIEYPLVHAEIYAKYKVKPPKGILFYGPPGCGKTLFAKVVASQSKAHFISIRGPEVLNRWVGESEAKIREVFDLAKEKSPAIIFFDEIDAIAPKRSLIASTDVTARIVSQMLTEMDGVEASARIIVMAATNRPDIIDEALLRPGRFDKLVYIPPPDKEARQAILRVCLKDRPVSEDVNYNKLADLTEGYSGADIAAVCNEAATMVLRERISEAEEGEARKITNKDLVKAIKKVKPSITPAHLEMYKRFRGAAD